MARAIQCFAPGIPQIYYVGLFAGENDIELLESTKEGRNINRHYYSKDEIAAEVQRPVVQKLFALLKFRNSCPAFDGEIKIEQGSENELNITWKNENSVAKLEANLLTKEYTILAGENEANIAKVF